MDFSAFYSFNKKREKEKEREKIQKWLMNLQKEENWFKQKEEECILKTSQMLNYDRIPL